MEDRSTLTPAILAQLPAGNAGVPISSPLFAPKLLAVQALLLHAVLRVPPDMLWQTIIRLNILTDYGLYAPTSDQRVVKIRRMDQPQRRPQNPA